MEGVITKQLVKAILTSPQELEWSIQGLGMLRTYLSPDTRLHIWDASAKMEGASELHTHPWDFDSFVVVGSVRNYRFEMEALGSHGASGIKRMRQTIRCGEGGGLIGEPVPVVLKELPTETYEEGQSYRQAAEEIHRSAPDDGTITIITREFRDDTEHAYVYFRDEWGTAEPRPATRQEIARITRNALRAWFK